MGKEAQMLCFTSPQKKRVKKVPKGVYLKGQQKVRKSAKIDFFLRIQIYRTPFTLFTIFDKILRKDVIYYSHPIFQPHSTISGFKIYLESKFFQFASKMLKMSQNLYKNIYHYVLFLFLAQFKNHLWGKDFKHYTFYLSEKKG